MAVLGEIRKRSWILILVVALGLLAFLIEPGSLINNLKQVNPNTYGEVNDRVVSREDYDVAFVTLQNQNQGRMPEAMLKNRAWESALQNKLVQIQAEKAGLEVNEELVFAYNPEMKGLIAQIQEAAKAGDPQAQAQLNNLPNYMKSSVSQLRNNLYSSLVSATLLTNKLEVQHENKNAGQQAAVKYAKIDYDAYNEKNPVEVTDKDLQAYIDEHKNLFKRESSTNFHYVYFPNTPSANDKAMFAKNMDAFKNGGMEYDIETGEVIDSIQSFASATNDSLYIGQYSLEPYNPQYYSSQDVARTFNPEVGKWIRTAAIGSVYGPFEKSGLTIMSKLTGKKPMDSIKTKHILIAYAGSERSEATRTKEQAETLANEILAQVKANPGSFSAVAIQNSDDKGSAQKGGDLGFVTERSGMVPEFYNFLRDNPKGTIGITETPFGYHIINVEDKKTGTLYKMANLVRQSRSSKATGDQLFKKANAFLAEVKDKDLQSFVDLATKDQYNQNDVKNVSQFQGVIQALNSDKDEDIIKWTFEQDRQLGDTQIFTTVNNDYIVVRLTGMTEAGMATPSQIREEYELTVRNEKIAKGLKGTFDGKSLDTIASENGGTVVSENLSFERFNIPNGGFEPKVVGAAFGLAQGKQSDAIGGNSGVFVIQSQGLQPNPNYTPNEQAVKTKLDQKNKSQFNGIVTSLRQEAEVKDERAKFN